MGPDVLLRVNPSTDLLRPTEAGDKIQPLGIGLLLSRRALVKDGTRCGALFREPSGKRAQSYDTVLSGY